MAHSCQKIFIPKRADFCHRRCKSSIQGTKIDAQQYRAEPLAPIPAVVTKLVDSRTIDQNFTIVSDLTSEVVIDRRRENRLRRRSGAVLALDPFQA
jgi:hypothetical protein